jgi:hypothetical protein
MKYTKIHPYDMFLLTEKAKGAAPPKPVGEVTITVSGPNGAKSYSFTQPLREFDGVTYLASSTVEPSERAVATFDCGTSAQREAAQAAGGPVTVTYDPESD